MSTSGYICRRRSIPASMLVLLLAVTGCSEIRLISEYDQATDQQVTSLQRDVETFFTAIERGQTQPGCSHASHEAFYAQATTDINLLIARNDIRDKNKITNDLLALLKDSIEQLELLHELADEENRCLGMNELIALRNAFGTQFGGILRLELAKKRGQTEGSAN